MSETVLFLILDATLKGTLLLGLVGILGWLFARQRPALRALLWGQVFIALLILPVASLVLPKLHVSVLPEDIPAVASYESVAVAKNKAPVMVDLDRANEVFAQSMDELGSGAMRAPIVTVPKSSDWKMPAWSTLLLGVYLFGLAVCLLRMFWGGLRLHRLRLQVYRFAGANVMARLNMWCRELGVKDGVDVGISDQVSVPTVIGVLRPLIVVPEHVADHGSDADWDGILVHELAHVKRHDAYWNVLGMVVTALYWFHPLVYWARRDLADTRECACDDWAVHTLGDLEGYATTLMEVTARTDRRLTHALGLDMARTSRVLHRVNRMVNLKGHHMPEMGRVVSVALLCVILMSAGLLGSLRPVGEQGLEHSWVKVTSGDEAALWLREQYFFYDYVAGYHEGGKLMAQFPEHGALKAWYVLHLLSNLQEDEARRVVSTMLEGDVWTDFARAFVLRDTRKDEALRLSERAWIMRPHDSDFLWMRAQVLWKAQGQDAAIDFIDRHRDDVDHSIELLALKGNILANQARYATDRGVEMEKWDAAFQIFKEAQRLDPNNVSAHFQHGFYLSSLQRKAEAYPLVKRAAQLSPYAMRIHQIYWQVTLQMPNWSFEVKKAEVEADMDHFLKERDFYPEVLSAVANMMDRDLNQPEKHLQLSNRIRREFPNSKEAEWALVREYRGLRSQIGSGDFDSGTELLAEKEAYKKKLWEFVNRPDVQRPTLLGDAYRELFHILRADSTASDEDLLRVVQGMVKYEKANPNYVFYMGPIVLAERTSYFREAEEIAKQGFEAAIAWGKRKQQGRDGSQEDYVRGVNSMTARTHGALGWIYFLSGRLEEAEGELLKAQEILPDFWSNLHHLGQLYIQKKNWDRAESYFVQGMKLQFGEDAKDMEMGLERLYQERYGVLDGFDMYFTAIKRDVAAYQKKRIQSERVDRVNPVPRFDFECLDGSVVSLDDLQGKVVVIDVGMRVSERRLREVQQFYEDFAGRDDVVVLHVNMDVRLEDIMQAGTYGFPMTMGYGFIQKAQVNRFPTTWFLDRHGKIVYEAIGTQTTNAWLKKTTWRVEALLEEPL